MGNFKTSVLALMLTAYVVKIKGDSNPTEDRLYKLERITQNLVNELNEKEIRIEKLETIVAGQRKELQTQNNAVMELNEVIIQREHQNEENTKRLNELEHFVRSLSQQYRSQQQSVARDKAVRPEDKLNLLEDYKGQDVPTTDPQNKENVRTNESLSYRADFQQYQIRHHGQRDVSRIRRQSSDNVAFHAYLKGSRCYGSHETFVFDVEETDIGDAYNVHDGIFDVPVTGTYVFTVTTVSMSRRYYSAEIIINGVVKGISFADAEEVGDFHSGTATIVVHVNAGDHVFVRRGAAASNNCDVYSLDVYGRTTFSGWLLF